MAFAATKDRPSFQALMPKLRSKTYPTSQHLSTPPLHTHLLQPRLIPNMAFVMSDGTEGSFLKKTNEMLVINGFRRMPFTEEHLTRKNKLLTETQMEKGTTVENDNDSGKSSNDETVTDVSACKSVWRRKMKKKKGHSNSHTHTKDAASDYEESTDEPASEVEGTKETKVKDATKSQTSLPRHSIKINYPQFLNILLLL